MIKNKKLPKIKLVIIVLAILIASTVAFLYISKNQNNSSDQVPSTGQTEPIDLNPSTKEDAKRAEANKEKNLAREEAINNQSAQSPNTKKSVKPTITYSGLYGSVVEVGGYVSDVFEDGGTCTATFTQGDTSFSKSVTAIKNINSVDCPVMSAKKDEFSQSNKWLVTVTYDSLTAFGKSDANEIEIK